MKEVITIIRNHVFLKTTNREIAFLPFKELKIRTRRIHGCVKFKLHSFCSYDKLSVKDFFQFVVLKKHDFVLWL